MDNGFSILMLIFGIALLLYAAALSSGNPSLLPYTVQPTLRRKDKKGQVRHIGKITAICAVPIICGGIAGTYAGNRECLIAGGITAAVLICAAILRSRSRKHQTDRSDNQTGDENE
ncbi:MAG: hypothetical protein IKI58_12045 [Oscillospiraceae bacterium]|nr:hypothetical protein [Oscillospiraceae bacterium]